MTLPGQKDDAEAEAGLGEGRVGEVETAGETTAAGMVGGPADTRPVGASTLVKVAGEPEGAAGDSDG